MVKIIAEVGSVHDGSIGNALKLIDLCKEVGADTVKFQTHIAEFETTSNAPGPAYFQSESRYDYFVRTGFTKDEWLKLKLHCDDLGIEFLSSPFSVEAAILLKEIGLNTFKIASGELTNFPLLDFLNEKENTVLISSGMSIGSELEEAFSRLSNCGERVIFQCTSEYPCPPENVGLSQVTKLRQKYGVAVGLSDHYEKFSASIAAVALGATYIEKHITFSRLMYGSDAKTAMEPEEFKRFVLELRDISIMMDANPIEKTSTYYEEMRRIFQKSIYWRVNKKAGEKVTKDDFSYLKPAIGISASRYLDFMGKTITTDVFKGTPMVEEQIDD